MMILSGLKKYFRGIKKDCNSITNLEVLNSNLVKDPALYSLISSKYNLSLKKNISFNIDIVINFDVIPISSYVLTRILGILFDNAIEAASVSKEKEIYFRVFKSFSSASVKKYIISIENSYLDKNIDLNKIREKGYTSKSKEKGSHGIGLWEVNKILKKNENLNLYTSKNEKFFIQQLEIFE